MRQSQKTSEGTYFPEVRTNSVCVCVCVIANSRHGESHPDLPKREREAVVVRLCTATTNTRCRAPRQRWTRSKRDDDEPPPLYVSASYVVSSSGFQREKRPRAFWCEGELLMQIRKALQWRWKRVAQLSPSSRRAKWIHTNVTHAPSNF